MKRGIWIALVLAGCLGVALRLCAQSDSGKGKKQPAQQQAAPQNPPKPTAPADPNAFPTDTSDVPVMPSKPTDVPTGTFSDVDSAAASLPGDDLDPVRSPDAAAGSESVDPAQVSSSRASNLDSLLPNPGDEEPAKRGRKGAAPDGPPKETAKEDLTVAKYNLDQKNWKAAQSRFQSALVLSPEDPEVYWGLAESARHMGDFAVARANYLKVIEYDPDSKHAKEAQKALKDPQIAEAKTAAGPQ